jgi:hypothetical protein
LGFAGTAPPSLSERFLPGNAQRSLYRHPISQRALDRPPTGHELVDNYDHRDDQQDVDQTTSYRKCEKTDGPKHQKQNY